MFYFVVFTGRVEIHKCGKRLSTCEGVRCSQQTDGLNPGTVDWQTDLQLEQSRRGVVPGHESNEAVQKACAPTARTIA